MLRKISYGVIDGESPIRNVETHFDLQNTEGITERKPWTIRPSSLEAKRLGVN
jgi:hypothetical protein